MLSSIIKVAITNSPDFPKKTITCGVIRFNFNYIKKGTQIWMPLNKVAITYSPAFHQKNHHQRRDKV